MLMSVQTIHSSSEDNRFNYCITLLNLNSHSEVTENEVICRTCKVYLPNSGVIFEHAQTVYTYDTPPANYATSRSNGDARRESGSSALM